MLTHAAAAGVASASAQSQCQAWYATMDTVKEFGTDKSDACRVRNLRWEGTCVRGMPCSLLPDALEKCSRNIQTLNNYTHFLDLPSIDWNEAPDHSNPCCA